jgi:hypothetical protein
MASGLTSQAPTLRRLIKTDPDPRVRQPAQAVLPWLRKDGQCLVLLGRVAPRRIAFGPGETTSWSAIAMASPMGHASVGRRS